MFEIDVEDNVSLKAASFPTYEEALGVLDLADNKNESFKDFPNINYAFNNYTDISFDDFANGPTIVLK
jgi:hypothetical protein